MFCGYMRTECSDITVENLINILSQCKNKNAVIKYSDTNHFFIHFDQDGEFINFSKTPSEKLYGDRGADNKCSGCEAYNNIKHRCECNPEDCMNYLGYYGEATSNKEEVSTTPVNNIIKKKKVTDPSDISINGSSVAMCGECDIPASTNNISNNINMPISQDMMNQLIAASLEKMLKGLRE